MDIKSLLKFLKLNESAISMVLGILVVVTIGYLVVQNFRERGQEQPIPKTTSTKTVKPEEGKVPTSLPKMHKVEKGEHLWGIAERYFDSGYNWVDIAKENKLANPGKIEVGQELIIPEVAAKKATVIPDQKTVFGPVIDGASYTVAQGDHLWGIAVRAYGDGYQWVNLVKVNKIANPDVIIPGKILTIPREGAKK